jgi:ABC-2 type transport system permease protein
MKNINAIATIVSRDFIKFLRDKVRILATFIFPFLFIGILGSSLQSNLASEAGYNFMAFVFTGVVGQILFQSTAAGIISLIEDRKNDFAQELFVSPVSRYTIIVGKIIGETSVALTQGIGVVIFGIIIGVPLTITQFISLAPAALVSALLGGSFGVLVLSNLSSERSANQIFPFVIFPQFFLAGVFSPIKNLPTALDILSKISPMRYAVDLVRGIYYAGTPEYSKIVLATPFTNLVIITLMFFVFLIPGTLLFVRKEKNK